MKDLFDAIKEQDLDKVQKLTKELAIQGKLDAPLHIEGIEYSPLTYAISAPSLLNNSEGLKIVKVLLKNGADPNFQVIDYYPLDLAVERGNLKLVEMLVSHKAFMHEEVLGNLALKATDENLENSLKLMKLLVQQFFFKDKKEKENVLGTYQELKVEQVFPKDIKDIQIDRLIKQVLFKNKKEIKLDPYQFIDYIMANSWTQSSMRLKPFLNFLYDAFISIPSLLDDVTRHYLSTREILNNRLYLQLTKDFTYDIYYHINFYTAFEVLISLYSNSDQDDKLLKNIREILTIILDLSYTRVYYDNICPLTLACEYGCEDIVKLLIDKTISSESRGSELAAILTNLMYSSKSHISNTKKLEMIELLLDNGANPAINRAIIAKKFDIVRLMLERTPDIKRLNDSTLELLSEADPEFLEKSGIKVNNRFKPKAIEQESTILTKIIHLIHQVKLFFEEKWHSIRKSYDESSVDYSHITVSLFDPKSNDVTQSESLPNQPDTSLVRPTQNSNEQSKH